ncbi:MAG TPA: hypothetical protein VIT92_16505, partial [Burkholderiaceae bacterium]
MTATPIAWLFMFAIGQGLFLSALLLTDRQPALRAAHRLLACLVLAFVAIIAHAWLGLDDGYASHPRAARSVAAVPLLFGPLLWLYLRAVLDGEAPGRRSLLHFAPFVLGLLAWLPVYLYGLDLRGLAPASDAALPPYLGLFALFKLAHFSAYMLACHRFLARADGTRSDPALVRALRRLIALLFTGLLASALLLAYEQFRPALALTSDMLGGLTLLVFIYGVALQSVRLPGHFAPPPAPQKTPVILLDAADTARALAAL